MKCENEMTPIQCRQIYKLMYEALQLYAGKYKSNMQPLQDQGHLARVTLEDLKRLFNQ